MTAHPKEDRKDLAEGLNREQREAVLHGEGPLLVLAGAGSGKTRVITHRIAHLVASGVPASQIVAVTFTNKAAREMKDRVQRLLRMERLPLFVGTFHSFAVRLLRRWAPLLGYGKSFTVYDASDQLALVKRIATDLGLDDKSFPAKGLLGRISDAKNRLIPAGEFARTNTDFYGVRATQVYTAYQRQLRAADAMDFDDLISNAVALFGSAILDPETDRPLSERLRHEIRWLLVDEYQDTNHAQAELIRRLTGDLKNLCAVGDDDQSIYRWRGAEVGHILRFDRDFPGARTVKLEQNYRSTGRILEAAGAVVAGNERRHRKKLWTDRGKGEKVRLYHGRDERDEAHWIAEDISRLRGEGRRLGDVAVLFRTNAQSRPFEDEFRRRDWPYVLVGGTKFYERAEIKDALAYLRLALQPADDGALLRIVNVPARGIGATTIETLRATAAPSESSLWCVIEATVDAGRGNAGPERVETLFARTSAEAPAAELSDRARKSLAEFRAVVVDVARSAQAVGPSKAISYLLERTHYRSQFDRNGDPQDMARLENLQELVRAAEEFEAAEPGASARDFLDAVSLTAEIDQVKEGDEKGVVLMTLHAAKGLEFPAVFLAGLEEGLLPHRSSLEDPEELEEERRLAYVGMTRAKDFLTLSLARYRSLWGQSSETIPSRFVRDLPHAAIEEIDGWKRDEEANREWNDDEVDPFAPPPRSGGFGAPSRAPASRPGAMSFAPKRTPGPPPAPGELRKGMKVRHAQYGIGVILMEEGTGDAKKLTVYFDRAGRKKLVAKYAPLQPL